MAVLQTSKSQALLVTDSTNVKDKGRNKGEETKFFDSKPRENQNYSAGASISRKENTRCSYCMRGFHPEIQCMKKTLDQLKNVLVQNNISLTQGVEKGMPHSIKGLLDRLWSIQPHGFLQGILHHFHSISRT